MAIVESHLRVDLSGGTLDLWPLYNFVSGAKTINCAISLKACCEFTKMSDPTIKVEIENLNYIKVFKNLKQLLESEDSELQILKPVLKTYVFATGFHIKTSSQSPVGAGLGGSSTLLVAIVRAIDEELGVKRSEEDYVSFVCNLESLMLKTPAGTQDYYQAIHPGLSYIDYQFWGRTRIPFKSPWLEKNKKDFVLIYSGLPHHSGLNNWKIYQNCVNKDEVTLRILQNLKNLSEDFYQELGSQDADQLPALLKQELNLRRELATGFVNDQLEIIISFLQKNEIDKFKICGAGGGGCLWAFVPQEKRKGFASITDLSEEIKILECELIL